MKTPKLIKQASAISVVMSVATLFLAGVLIYSAVTQFSDGHWFSGCVSILGTVLLLVSSYLLISDLSKKNKKTQDKTNG